VLGALNEQQHLTPTQAIALTSHEVGFPSKKPFAISLDTVVGIFFEKIVKIGGRASCLGSPRVGSVFALVQGHSLLSLKAVANS
jgi:hypothetical protein